MQYKKELTKKREQFSNSGLKISLDKPIKTHKEKKSRKQQIANSNTHNEHETSNRSINSNNDEKATELYQMLIQTLLKESKLKVGLFKCLAILVLCSLNDIFVIDKTNAC